MTPPATPVAEPSPPDRLSLVLFSGSFDKVHYALSMAAAALAVNKPATLFFTMGAARALLADDAGTPGWHRLHATEDGLSPAAANAVLEQRNLAGFEELLAACAALGATVMVCEMGLKALGLDQQSLRRDISITPGGLVTFLGDASRHGAMLFI